MATMSGGASARLNTQSFIIHWPKGKPADVGVICEIAGVDPTYGFPRVCDSSALAWPFKFNDTAILGAADDHRNAGTVDGIDFGDVLSIMRAKGTPEGGWLDIRFVPGTR